MPFQMPQMFSQVSYPTPLKKAACRLSVLSLFPAVADVDHVARLEPFAAADHGDERVFPIAPRHAVPVEHLVAIGIAFGLEHQRMAGGSAACGSCGGRRRRCRRSRHPRRSPSSGRPGSPAFCAAPGGCPCPRACRKEHADATAVKIGDHLSEASEPAGHVAQEVELVAIVDADVGIDGPEQHAIDAAVAMVEIGEEAVDGVAAGLGVVEVAVFHHGLRLDEAALGPLQFGALVEFAVQAGADTTLLTVLLQLLQPLGGVGLRGRAGKLLALRRVLGVLGQQERDCQQADGRRQDQKAAIVQHFSSADIIPSETTMSVTRRSFLLGAGSAMMAQAAPPADQVTLGVIGSGSRGTFVMTVFQKDPPLRVGAICDVYEPNLEKALSDGVAR